MGVLGTATSVCSRCLERFSEAFANIDKVPDLPAELTAGAICVSTVQHVALDESGRLNAILFDEDAPGAIDYENPLNRWGKMGCSFCKRPLEGRRTRIAGNDVCLCRRCFDEARVPPRIVN